MFVADSLNCVVAQRLIRLVCTQDRETYAPDAATAELLRLKPEQLAAVRLVRGVPSPANFHTGYHGRTAIFEVMRFDPEIREAVLHGKSGREIGEIARRKGMQSLEQSAVNKVLGGITSLEEMHRVLIAP
jgi:type II secretory ATPase GspE/PulE/Tfp pilus assembly ATPase PilB-like protein